MSKKYRNTKYHQKQQAQEDKAEAFQFIQKINFILARIREENVGIMETKPSTDPNKQTIVKVLFPPDGGVITYFDKLEHPAKGFCYGETVETVDEVKKTMMAFLTGLFESLSKNKIRTILFVLFFRKQFETMARRLVIQLDYRMRRVRQKPERYCISAREFYRVFNLMATWYPKYKTEIESFRNIWCMVWEYDDAYRYTGQDVLPEFNKDAAKKDIAGEIKRMIDLILERDDRGLFIKFLQMKKMLFLLRFSKSTRIMIERFFSAIDLDRIKMDEDDKFHARFKVDYDWDASKIQPNPSIDYKKQYEQQEKEKARQEEKTAL